MLQVASSWQEPTPSIIMGPSKFTIEKANLKKEQRGGAGKLWIWRTFSMET